MARQGFIHDKLDTKFLILYIMARVAAPIDFPTLTDLTMIDEGVDYFEFAEAVPELVKTGHLLHLEELYSITELGRKNGADCESSLPYSVRVKCDEKLAKLNAGLRRKAQVQSRIEPQEHGNYTLSLSLRDDTGVLLEIALLCPSREQAQQLSDQFQSRPERIYNGLLELLREQGGEVSTDA